MEFKIVSKVGIGPVKLGMSRAEVSNSLGKENYSGSSKNSEKYFNYSFQVEFTKDKVSFIGVSYDDAYSLVYEGYNVFDLEAPKLFRLISANESEEHQYDSSEYLFPEQIITVWDADEQYDRIGGEERVVWAQVGLGSEVYLKAIELITSKPTRPPASAGD